MKLRSHEILGTPTTPSSGSRLKQLFQSKKTLFKKNPPRSAAIIHQIPGYVRKSIFRFLLEVKSTPGSPPPPAAPSPPPPPSNRSSKTVRPPPVMGVQALKTKKKQHTHPSIPVKRSHRIKHQPTSVIINDLNRSFDEQPISATQQPNNYDMTILHLNIEDDEEESIFAQKTSTNQKKQIPEWARKNELEIAICNQIYFHRNPSEIFGDAFDCSPAHLRTVLHSMLPNVDLFDDNQHQSANRY